MFKSFLSGALLAALVAVAPLAAKTYTVPDPNPVAVVTIPDDWTATTLPKGVEGLSDDESVYVAIEVTDLADAAKSIADAVVWLKSKGVEIDRATQKQEPIEFNGMTGVQVKWDGKDEDGPTQVSLTLLQVTDAKGLVLTYWASPEGAKDNAVALNAIITSLKAVK